jgi:hypothetical protein
MRPSPLLALVALLAGCDASSQLEPGEPLDALDAAETAQLCRFTTDLVQSPELSCDADAPAARLTDFDACTVDPPWDACPAPDGEVADIASWEDCVNRLLEDPCGAEAEARCWHFRCP